MYPEEIRNYISGDYSAADEQFVKEWIKEDPSRRKELQELKKVWNLTADLGLTNNDEVESAWSVVYEKMKHQQQSHTTKHLHSNRDQQKQEGWKVFLKVAAVLLITAGLFAIYTYENTETQQMTEQEQVHESVIRAEYGEQVRFRMRDGSMVTLNSGSTIRHDNQFGKDNRQLILDGEAYFEVNNTKQEHPFLVKTKDAYIQDIGTAFNINAYEESEATEVVVSDGEVEVAAQPIAGLAAQKPVRVSKGRMVSVQDSTDELVVQEANLDQALGWLNKKLIFDNERFENIVKRLERYYNINIQIKDDSLKEKVVKASFDNERIEKVMSVLAISLGAEYNIEGDSISFKSEDQF